ncbi:MAG: hypothetical protein JO040_15375 [Gemmatimonadetes bacterium]|nr:hypothetical protein [Gemmatimonadota bacterium]
MNRLRFLLLALLALPAAGCGSDEPTESDYLSVVRQTVRFAEADARKAAVPGSATGPLLVDVKSFRGGSLRATGSLIDLDRVSKSIDRPFRATVPDSSFNCVTLELGPSCWVPKNGVFVHLNLASRAPQQITMNVTTTTTASNFIPPVLCDRAYRLEFVKGTKGGEWVLQEKQLVKSC